MLPRITAEAQRTSLSSQYTGSRGMGQEKTLSGRGTSTGTFPGLRVNGPSVHGALSEPATFDLAKLAATLSAASRTNSRRESRTFFGQQKSLEAMITTRDSKNGNGQGSPLVRLRLSARFCRNPACRCLERLHVRSLPSLGPLHHVELHGLTFLQALETI